VLYVLMGVCAAWVYLASAPEGKKRRALAVYAISLGFNFLWSIFFFRLRWFLFSFFWLLGLLFLVLRTVADYRDVSPRAAYLQIPYALWVTFAGYLNFGIWFLNR
jgi:tryptophan-rich sensory protein